MSRETLVDELEEAIASGTGLRPVVAALRRLRDLGATRDEVQGALDAMRDRTHDEATEDRILEAMDVVSGFCSRENNVWDD
jgi:hypothetical protein